MIFPVGDLINPAESRSMELRVPIIYLQQLAAHLQAEGVDPARCLKGTALNLPLLQDPAATASRKDCHTFFVAAARLTPQPGMVLRAARKLRPTDHGFLGHAMICAPDLRTSLKLLERFAKTRAIPLSYHLQPIPGGARLHMQLTAYMGTLKREYTEWGLMIALSTNAPQVEDALLRPSRIVLDYPRPAYGEIYDELLQCPVEFGAASCYMDFSDAALDRPTVNSNRELQHFCEQRCELILHELQDSGDFVQRVRARLLAGPPPFPDADAVAAGMHISSRVLRRRLQEEGRSFRQIVQQVREELARQYLTKVDLTVDEVSTLLGYSEAPAFSRAFKSWTGQSPERFRESLLAEPAAHSLPVAG